MTTNRAEYFRDYRAKNREKRKEYLRNWRANNPAHLAKRTAYDRARQADPEFRAKKAENDRLRKLDPLVREKRAEQYRQRAADPTYKRRSIELHRVRKYGLSSEDFDAMFAAQGSMCANSGCESISPGRTKGWCVDHCHTTGKIRGILCHNCNLSLGLAKDCKTRLLGLVGYLDKHTEVGGHCEG
jgi:Autographiviridae endonuclease VII